MNEIKALLIMIVINVCVWIYQDEIITRYYESQTNLKEISVSDGIDGMDGLEELYSVYKLTDGYNLLGYTINMGYDRNGNGVLDSFEVKKSVNVYNGTDN